MGDVSFENTMKVVEKVHYKGELRIIGLIVDINKKDNILGYVIMVEKTKMFKAYSVQQTLELMKRFKFVNAELNGGKIIDTECSINRLPLFSSRLEVIGNDGITILGEITVNGEKTNGYRVITTNGKVADLTETDLINLVGNKNLLINAKLVNSNNKTIVSAIKGEFTKIEKEAVKVDTAKSEAKKRADTWRKNKHIEKIEKSAIHVIESAFINDRVSTNVLKTYKEKGKSIPDMNKFIKRAIVETFTASRGYSLGNKELELVKGIRNESERNWRIQLVAVCQFVLYNDKNYNKIVSDIVDALYARRTSVRKRFSKRAKSLKTRYFSLLERDKIASEKISKLVDEVEARLYSLEMKSKSNDKYEADPREFRTTTFTSEHNIEQLGFTMLEQNKNKQITTDYGFNKTLKYLGDCIGKDYETIKSLSRCLGDVLSIAYIEKLLSVYGDTLQQDGYAKRYNMRKINIRASIQTIIIIAYMYGSKAMQYFLEDNIEVATKLENLGIEIPDFEELSTTDYGLDKSIDMYYASGFCVYYKDNYTYGSAHLNNAKILNYRQLGVSHDIDHNILTNNLASTVSILAPSSFSSDDIVRVIGSLRFI